MPIKTITQIRAETPTVTLAGSDIFLMDQATKTVAGTLAELKTFVRPANVTGALAGLMSSTDKTKLDGVANNATANSADSTLLDRANHTGTQAIGTVVNLQIELNKKLESVDVAGVSGLQAALDEKADTTAIPNLAPLTERVDELETGIDAKLDENNPAPSGGFTFPGYTFAEKPDAATNENRYIEITDSADGIVLCRSNGTDWVKVAVVSADPVLPVP